MGIKKIQATPNYRTRQKSELVCLEKCKVVFQEMKYVVNVIKNSLNRLKRLKTAEERVAYIC